MSVIQGNAIESGLAAYEIPNSLRFNSADSAYLSWTPASAGNRKTWTWSGWVKKSSIGTADEMLFGQGNTYINWTTSGTIECNFRPSTTSYYMTTTQVLRDPSAWYHIIVVLDTTQATAANRAKMYINGVQVTSFSNSGYTSMTQNFEPSINTAAEHNIGKYTGGGFLLNGYLTEINFIDGQALDPTSFGEYNSETGVWQPKAYTGSYGTNGFYLPMTQDQIVEGFNTVLWRGNGGTQRITGVGFSPDLVWIKDRSNARNHYLYDSVRGALKELYSNLTNAESTNTIGLSSFGSDGFTLNNGDNAWNGSGNNYVGWCWDAGNSTVSNTDGTITSSVRASQTYGFSVVTWTNAGNGNDTVGHGLGTAPKLIITKKRSTANDWYTFTTAIDGSYDYLKLNATDAKVDSAKAAPTLTVFTTDMGDTSTAVAYCFTDSNYSKIGSYTGNGSSSGPTVTLGWKPAFVMIKRTDTTGSWYIYDTARQAVNPMGSQTDPLVANTSGAEGGADPSWYIDATDTGFTIKNASNFDNASGGTYIYAAFKDQREAAFWRDFSGNGNHWQPNNLDFNDSVVDVPTNYGTDTGVGAEVRGNYCTWNPVNGVTASLTNGNLDLTYSSAGGAVGTMAFPSSGKWYWEVTVTGSGNNRIGICLSSLSGTDSYNVGTGTFLYVGLNGNKYTNGSASSYGATYTANDIIGVAVDADAGTVVFYKNNSSQGTAFSGLSFSTSYSPTISVAGAGASMVTNFGQLPFAYTAPSGFKALCTQNLPEPTVVDGGDYFNTVLYTGNSSTQSISGVGFQPDMVWVKDRSAAQWHNITDVVRGVGKEIFTNATNAEETNGGISSFNADGFSLINWDGANKASDAYVAWNWKAGGTGVSNTAGSITSTVSANTTAGFSIVTYTGNGSANQTVGHGLGVAPAFGILKDRDTNSNNDQWQIFHTAAGDKYGYFTTAAFAGTAEFYPTSGSSTTVTIARGSPAATTNESGDRYVMYLFAPVEGYSAFGSYTGNGSADGPFVYTGFRPAFVMCKATSDTSHWVMSDSKRPGYNVTPNALFANLSNAESTDRQIDLLSNGFKLRQASLSPNDSGVTFIYMAFAETPFSLSLAR